MQSQQYVETLQALQRIRDISEGQLNLPQICVVGDQTSGKSSTLQLLTGITFPVKSGICTKAPIVVECCHKPSLSVSTFEIQDPETKEYKRVSMNNLETEITKCQKVLISKLESAHAGPKPKISRKEIRVRVQGPDQTDIIVVDLPGIINAGPGKKATRELIRRYISEEQTLILLVSEAKQDAELTGAIDLAMEFDESMQRTLRILTKFDTFDSEDAKATAVQLVVSQAGQPLGAHAVVCRSGGGNFKQEDEAEVLSKAGLPKTRGGVSRLKARLPAIYAQLIQTNLAGLKVSAESQLHQAELALEGMGDDPLDAISMIRACQRALASKFCKFEQELTPAMKIFKEAIHATKEKITQQWVSTKLSENVFRCPFFQGEEAFLLCLNEIAEMWKPHLDSFMEAVNQCLGKSMKFIKNNTVGVSKMLAARINATWTTHCKKLIKEFTRVCTATLKEERDFGTVNHYLIDKCAEELVLPETLVEDFIDRLEHDDLLAPNTYESHQNFLEHSADGPTSEGSPIDWKTNLQQALSKAKAAWVANYKQQSLHQHLELRVFAAVKAAWAVEKKTFTDMVMKKCRDSIIKEREGWVQTVLLTDKDIRESAVEDATVEADRAELKKTMLAMQRCLAELSGIMSHCDASNKQNVKKKQNKKHKMCNGDASDDKEASPKRARC